MKYHLMLALSAVALSACDVKVSNPPVTEKVEKNTTIVNPPAAQEKKTESETKVTKTPGGTEVEKKTETTTK